MTTMTMSTRLCNRNVSPVPRIAAGRLAPDAWTHTHQNHKSWTSQKEETHIYENQSHRLPPCRVSLPLPRQYFQSLFNIPDLNDASKVNS